MVKAKKFVVAQAWKGEVKESDIRLEEETLPALRDGEALFEAVFLSVDPYMRITGSLLKPGTTIVGEQVAKVVDSRNKAYPIGSYVTAHFGWRSHTIVSGVGENFQIIPIDKDVFTGVPLSFALGALGMPGQTAYLGFEHYTEAKLGDVFLVNAAAGAVGSIVGQLAKLKGCKVIGYAGSDAKCQWLKELGFDHAFNYKTQDLDKTLDQAASKGVNIYWDHVGGNFSSTVVVKHMALYGRVITIGTMDNYSDLTIPLRGGGFHDLLAEPLHEGYTPWNALIMKRLTMRGFAIQCDFTREQKAEAVMVIRKYIKEGKIQFKETVTDRFENMPKAFLSLFKGDNIGKAVVKV